MAPGLLLAHGGGHRSVPPRCSMLLLLYIRAAVHAPHPSASQPVPLRAPASHPLLMHPRTHACAAEVSALEQELAAEVDALREGQAALQELRQQPLPLQATPGGPRPRPQGGLRGSADTAPASSRPGVGAPFAGTPAPLPAVTPLFRPRGRVGGAAAGAAEPQGVGSGRSLQGSQGGSSTGAGGAEAVGGAAAGEGAGSRAAELGGGAGSGSRGRSGRYASRGSGGGGVTSSSGSSGGRPGAGEAAGEEEEAEEEGQQGGGAAGRGTSQPSGLLPRRAAMLGGAFGSVAAGSGTSLVLEGSSSAGAAAAVQGREHRGGGPPLAQRGSGGSQAGGAGVEVGALDVEGVLVSISIIFVQKGSIALPKWCMFNETHGEEWCMSHTCKMAHSQTSSWERFVVWAPRMQCTAWSRGVVLRGGPVGRGVTLRPCP